MTAVAFVADDEKKRRSWPAVVAASAVVGLIAAGLAWLAHSWFATGPQPSEALPASTLAYVAIDLDPAGEQKMEALDALGKFPEFGADDPRRDVFKVVTSDSGCDLKFDQVEDWLGHRVAFAMVDLDRPEPVLVLQLDGDEGLVKGLKAVGECVGDEVGSAHNDEWAVIARSDKVAERVLAEADKEPLSDDADFKKWTGKAGEPGIATLYVSAKAGDAMLEAIEKDPEMSFYLAVVPTSLDPGGFAGPMSGFFAMTMLEPDFEDSGEWESGPEMEPLPVEPGDVVYPGMPGCPEPEQPDFETMSDAEIDAWFEEHDPQYRTCIVDQDGTVRQMTPAEERAETRRIEREMAIEEEHFDEEYAEDDFGWGPEISDALRKSLADFSGLGGVLRFEDGALELEIVGDRIAGGVEELSDGDRADAQLGLLPETAAIAYGLSTTDGLGSRFAEVFGSSMLGFSEDPVKEFEKSSGLRMTDLDALGGGSVSVVIGDPRSMERGPAELELAVVLDGDTAAVESGLGRLQKKSIPPLTWQRDGDVVVAGTNEAFVQQVVDGDGLDDSGRYREVVPGSDDASMVFFVDFDADDWLVGLAPQGERDGVRPLDTLGISRTTEDGLDHTTLRLTLD